MLNEPLLTPQEAADLLRVPVSWIYAHVPPTIGKRTNLKPLPYYRFGRLLRFKASELERWMEQSHQNGVSPPGSKPGGDAKATPIQRLAARANDKLTLGGHLWHETKHHNGSGQTPAERHKQRPDEPT